MRPVRSGGRGTHRAPARHHLRRAQPVRARRRSLAAPSRAGCGDHHGHGAVRRRTERSRRGRPGAELATRGQPTVLAPGESRWSGGAGGRSRPVTRAPWLHRPPARHRAGDSVRPRVAQRHRRLGRAGSGACAHAGTGAGRHRRMRHCRAGSRPGGGGVAATRPRQRATGLDACDGPGSARDLHAAPGARRHRPAHARQPRDVGVRHFLLRGT